MSDTEDDNSPLNAVLEDISDAAGGFVEGVSNGVGDWGAILKWALVAAILYFVEKKTHVFRSIYRKLTGAPDVDDPVKEE